MQPNLTRAHTTEKTSHINGQTKLTAQTKDRSQIKERKRKREEEKQHTKDSITDLTK